MFPTDFYLGTGSFNGWLFRKLKDQEGLTEILKDKEGARVRGGAPLGASIYLLFYTRDGHHRCHWARDLQYWVERLQTCARVRQKIYRAEQDNRRARQQWTAYLYDRSLYMEGRGGSRR